MRRLRRPFGVTGFLSPFPMTWTLVIVVAAGILGCESRQEVQVETRQDALEELEEAEMPDPCDLSGRWDVEETLTGGTCEGERLMTLPLQIAIEEEGVSLAISLRRGETVFKNCSGTRTRQGCTLDVTCSPAGGEGLDVSLQLELASDERLTGRDVLTYQDGAEFCNVELTLEGVPASEAAPEG